VAPCDVASNIRQAQLGALEKQREQKESNSSSPRPDWYDERPAGYVREPRMMRRHAQRRSGAREPPLRAPAEPSADVSTGGGGGGGGGVDST